MYSSHAHSSCASCKYSACTIPTQAVPLASSGSCTAHTQAVPQASTVHVQLTLKLCLRQVLVHVQLTLKLCLRQVLVHVLYSSHSNCVSGKYWYMYTVQLTLKLCIEKVLCTCLAELHYSLILRLYIILTVSCWLCSCSKNHSEALPYFLVVLLLLNQYF